MSWFWSTWSRIEKLWSVTGDKPASAARGAEPEQPATYTRRTMVAFVSPPAAARQADRRSVRVGASVAEADQKKQSHRPKI